MADPLNKNLFLIKEHGGLLKAAFNFDGIDMQTGEVILECREDHVSRASAFIRLCGYKATTPFDIRVKSTDGKPVLRVSRGYPVLASRVTVLDHTDTVIGVFRQKILSISGKFDVLDAGGRPLCRLEGGLTGWSYRFLAANDVELGRVTKKWAGLGRELLTGADDFVLQIDDAVPANSEVRRLIFASVICIGIALKIEVP